LVNNGDTARILVLAFLLCEIAAAQQFHAERIEVTWRRRGIERIGARVRRFRIGRHGIFRAQDSTGAREIRVRQHCTCGRPGHAWQLERSLHHRKNCPTRISRRFFHKTEIEFGDDIARGVETGIESCRFESTAKK
jgi:hypothetical protein